MSTTPTARAVPERDVERIVRRRNLRNGLLFIAPNFIGFALLVLEIGRAHV